jgi:hypothetical protein
MHWNIPEFPVCRGTVSIYGLGKFALQDDLSSFSDIRSMKAPAWPPREAELTGHKNITRPLYVLYAPTNRSIPDSKVVTECAKCARHLECLNFYLRQNQS